MLPAWARAPIGDTSVRRDVVDDDSAGRKVPRCTRQGDRGGSGEGEDREGREAHQDTMT